MFGNRLLSPTVACQYLGAQDLTVTTDWIDYGSADAQDSTTGAALPGDLLWGSVTVDNTDGSGAVYLKLRARLGAGDPITNEVKVKAGAALYLQTHGMIGTPVLTISVKKAVGADPVRVLGEFFERRS